MTQIIVTTGFIVAAIINLLPVMGMISAQQLERMYQVSIAGPDLAILMRHRAVLFAVVGILLVVAAFHAPLRLTAFVAGMLSMVSFIIFQMLEEGSNMALTKVTYVDYVGIAALAIGGMAALMLEGRL